MMLDEVGLWSQTFENGLDFAENRQKVEAAWIAWIFGRMKIGQAL